MIQVRIDKENIKLGLIGPMLWIATIISFIFAFFVFRYV